MIITQKLRNEFPGICALLSALIKAIHAVREYNKALNAMEALKARDPVNAWIWEVSEHSMLSYKDAREIHDFLTAHPSVCKHTRNMVTEFVIEMANCGHTLDMILRYLKQIEMELDRWASDKLSMRPK